MKNKGLIIGGVAIVAVGAFFWMRKKNAMASESIDDAKSDTSTEGGTTGKDDSKLTSSPRRQRIDGASVKGSGATASSTALVLTSKPINGVQDLDGTPLGLDISSAIINNNARLKVQDVIVNMNSGERQVLNYIAVVDYPTRTSQAFKDALSSLLGANASSLADSIYNKLLTASRFVPIATNNQGTFGRRDCRKEAYSRYHWTQQGKIVDFVNQCKREGGFDSGFDGSYGFTTSQSENAYTRTGFEIDKEDFQFNGDYIM
jgi:hypothetical protein